MEYMVGCVLAVVACGFAVLAGFDRDRVFYPTMLWAIGTYYILFAALAGSATALIAESVVLCAFLAVAAWAFHKNLWFAAAGLAAHGVFDVFHGGLIENRGVPVWWPRFCMTFDVVAGGWLALPLAKGSRIRAFPLR